MDLMEQMQLCAIHNENVNNRIDDIYGKLKEISAQRVTVMNGARKTLTHQECLQDLWHSQYQLTQKVELLEQRTEVLEDVRTIIAGMRKLLEYGIPAVKWLSIIIAFILSLSIGNVLWKQVLSHVMGAI